MASDGNPGGASSPFEWLSGGLFFGVGKPKAGGVVAIDSSKDPLALLVGVQSNLNRILELQSRQQQQAAAGGGGGAGSAGGAGAVAGAAPSSDSNIIEDDEQSNPSKFIAARLSRLRFLLYDERTSSRASRGGGAAPAVAGATLKALTAAGGGGGNSRNSGMRDLIPRLLENLSALPFESRKHVAAVFNYLLVCGLDGSDAPLYRPVMDQFRDYVDSVFDRIMNVIVDGHNSPPPQQQQPQPFAAAAQPAANAGAAASEQQQHLGDIALHYGSMYRSIVAHPKLYRQLVGTTERATRFVFPFMDTFVHFPNFDISSDAMESLRVVMLAGSSSSGADDTSAAQAQQQQQQQDQEYYQATQQAMAEIAAEFLVRDYDAIWDERFNPRLLSDGANYMTRRVALQILSGVLLTRSNYAVMIRYVNSRSNLMLVMHLLRDTSPHITLDAFHVFKVFVANPNKPPDVVKILHDNKIKLCRYLTTLHQEREESDTQFRDEKALIVATIEGL